jgi:hypothetical protein
VDINQPIGDLENLDITIPEDANNSRQSYIRKKIFHEINFYKMAEIISKYPPIDKQILIDNWLFEDNFMDE